jgi:holin-like protein
MISASWASKETRPPYFSKTVNLEPPRRFGYGVKMRIIQQLGIILAFALAGEIAARLLPGGISASVAGMLLMLAALALKLLKPEHVGESAAWLGGVMAFFFIPAAVSIVQNAALIVPVVWQFLFVCVICAIFTFFVSYGTVRILRVLLGKKS